METTEQEREEEAGRVLPLSLNARLCRDVDTLVALLREPTKAAAEGDWVCTPASWLTKVRAVLGTKQ